MIDYECVGNETLGEDTSKYQLNEIAEGENDGLLKKSNLNELAEEKTIEELVKEEPIFTIVELFKYVTFEMNEVNNQTTNNYNFNFTIEGKINKEISPKSIDAELELNDIKEKANCNFNIEEDKKANLNCKLNIDKYKAKKLFTFKTSEIITDDNEFYLAKLDEVVLINSVEDEKEEKEEKNNDKKSEDNNKNNDKKNNLSNDYHKESEKEKNTFDTLDPIVSELSLNEESEKNNLKKDSILNNQSEGNMSNLKFTPIINPNNK
jgi:hypothetical protein